MAKEKKKITKNQKQKIKNKKPETGDRVEIHLTKEIYEGYLLESPASEKDIVLLKLDNGYNIGFNKKNISEIKLIEKSESKEEKIELKKDSKKPNIAMIITGGTIASKYDPKTGGVKWLDSPESLFKIYPEIFKIANVSEIEIPFMKGSENMDPTDWKKISKVVEKYLNNSEIDGIILTQGTDTLHFTSSALSFFLSGEFRRENNKKQKINKPIVLTYSQRSIDRASSDANLNLQCSAMAAVSDIAEVVIVGHATTNDNYCYAMPGTKTRKLHSSRRDAFKTVNTKPIAKIYPLTKENPSGKIEKLDTYNIRTSPKNQRKMKADNKFEEKTALLKFYPGQDPEILDFYKNQGYKGIIIESLGLGHVATSEARKSWTNKVKELIRGGVVICATPQTIYGRLDPWVYSTGRELQEAGMIYLQDILPETAYIKLGWLLGHKDLAKNPKAIKEKMLENISGEFNPRIEE
ncbi:MAG TPA: Glu-tRNA(Gln) amidotransferase subunit GatD [Candidatus Nanoarchaeia archaeon]|nr:Glu-tRNA(Gln) amidotransferase subunit GatD [Candidatus Nanoarchaeia archaeon]